MSTIVSSKDIQEMKKPALQQLCRDLKIRGFSTCNVEELKKLLLTHLPSGETEEKEDEKEEEKEEEKDEKEKEEEKENEKEDLRQRIESIYLSLQKYTVEEQVQLLSPYFTLPIVQQDSAPSAYTSMDLEVKEEVKEEDEIYTIPYEERVRTITSGSMRPPVLIEDPEDLSNVLNAIEDTSEEVFKQIPLVRRNIQKCLGLV